MKVGGLHVEADIPAGAVPAHGSEQDLGARRHHRLPSGAVEVGDWAQQPPQSASVIVDTDRSDARQGHRAGMALTDPQSKAVAAATLAFPLREADPAALAVIALGLGVGGKRPAKVNCGLLEHLGRDLVAPAKAGYLLGDGAV